MAQGFESYLKKEKIEMFLVVALAMVLLVVLKIRFFGDASEVPVKAGAPRATMSEVSNDTPVADGPAIAVSTPRGQRAVRRAASSSDIPPSLSRDLFASLNPAYRALEPGKLRGAGGRRAGRALQAIFEDTRRPLAIINEEVVGVGDQVGSARVVTIEKDSVVISVGGREKTLRMDDEGAP